MKITKIYCILALIIFNAACAPMSSVTPEQRRMADYGKAPSKEYATLIKNYFAPILVDPTAPIYTFGSPQKGWDARLGGDSSHPVFGWQVCGTVNSKNRMGGYAGSVPYLVFFRDGKIVDFLMGESNSYSAMNDLIHNVCIR